MIRLIVDGRLPHKKIAEQLGADPKEVSIVMGLLEERGIRTRIPNTTKPPMEVVKSVLMFEVLLQVTGEAPSRCAFKAEAITGAGIFSSIARHPRVLIDAREFRNGYFWREAYAEMAGEIERVKEEYEKPGRKYEPSVSLASKLAKARLRAIKAKNKK